VFGRNVASYEFALAKTLLSMADRQDDRVTLDELAAPFARNVCEHLARVDKQATSRSSRFLETCRAFNRGELPEAELIASTARIGFNNVIDAFHVVGSGPDPLGVGAQIWIGASGGLSGGFRRAFERRACRERSCG